VSQATTLLKERYGRWAIVAGASEGLGAAFAEALAKHGMSLILIARRADVLEESAVQLRIRHGVEVVCLSLDLASSTLVGSLAEVIADRDIGVAVYNAAYSFNGELLEGSLDDALMVTDVNVRGPLRFIHAVAPAMVSKRRGALIIMSSIAGFTGTPTIATYAASKSFLTTLGEGLWAELKPRGVDVLVSCAGAIRTPNYLAFRKDGKDAPGTMNPETVVAQTLAALGRGPVVIPGTVNKLATVFLRRLIPRRTAVSIMEANIKKGNP
jgi:uncharacterized protein